MASLTLFETWRHKTARSSVPRARRKPRRHKPDRQGARIAHWWNTDSLGRAPDVRKHTPRAMDLEEWQQHVQRRAERRDARAVARAAREATARETPAARHEARVRTHQHAVVCRALCETNAPLTETERSMLAQRALRDVQGSLRGPHSYIGRLQRAAARRQARRRAQGAVPAVNSAWQS